MAGTAYIHIGTADHDYIGPLSQYIASALHISLPDQAGDMAGQRRAANAEVVGQILLGNHGILTQQGEDLLFTLGHRQISI